MKTPLNILHLEDNATDADLVRSLLESEGIVCRIRRVESREELEAAMRDQRFDLILSDYTLPSYDGLSALELARQKCPEAPFIFVSATIGEEAAVESLKQGAVDYILKDRIARLPAAVLRAVEQATRQAERQRIEVELRRRDELLRKITDSVDDLITVLDLDGRRVFSSRSYRHLLGDTSDSSGTDSFAEIHPADRERIRALFQKTVATGLGQRAEYRFQLADGTVRHVESQGSLIRDTHGRARNVVVVSRDVTERRVAERRIREQAALLEQASDAIWVTDMEQRVTYWNPGAERLYGWPAGEILGHQDSDIMFQDDAPRADTVWKSVLAEGQWVGELEQVTRAGQRIIVVSRRTLLRDADGEPCAVLNINTDVTETKQLEEQFLRAQRLETIGALASGIAHDLNNVLSPVVIGAELLQDELSTEPAKRMLRTMGASARRGGELVKQILSFARGVSGEHGVVHLHHLIKDLTSLMRDTFPRSIRVQCLVPDDLLSIVGDVTKLYQVLLNLCVNARDAMPNGGTLLIQAENVTLDNMPIPGSERPLSGPFVRLAVSDTGTGIPRDLLDKIFETFFTTKAAGKGTGLGLATVRTIAKDHGGFVEVSSEAGQGACFRVFLPAGAQVASQPTQALPAGLHEGRGELILLVDDEHALLEVTRATLETCGYRVLTIDNGAEALTQYKLHRSRIAAVVTDIMMPGLDGPVLIRSLRSLNPEVKIICVSGLAPGHALTEMQDADPGAFLRKPFTSATLLATLRKVLDSSGKAL